MGQFEESVPECCGFQWNCVQKRLTNLFERYGILVGKYPWFFLIIPCIVCAALSCGLMYQDTLRGADYLFTPLNSPYKYEEATIREYWANSDDLFYPGKDVLRRKTATVLVTAVDEGSVLRPQHALQFLDVMDYIVNNISTSTHPSITYEDVCLRFHDTCYTNSHAAFISTIYANQDQDRLEVTYPMYTSDFLADSIYLGDSLGGAETNESNRVLIAAKAWMVTYQLKSQTDQRKNMSVMWEEAFENQLRKFKGAPLLRIELTHSDTIEIELRRNAEAVTPRYLGCLVLLVVFSVCCVFTLGLHPGKYPVIDWATSSPAVAIAGVIAAGFGVASGQGLLYYCGVKHQDMVAVLPFLCLSIGVDNMFLVVACLRGTSSSDSIEERLGNTLSHAAVSITITSLTDAISFAVGAMTPLPAVQIFCSLAAASIGFTFLYQITFFMSIVVFDGRRQLAERHCLFPFIHTVPFSQQKVCVMDYVFRSGASTGDTGGKRKPWNKIFFEEYYAPFVAHVYVQATTVVLLIIYLGIAIWGMQKMGLGFEVEKLLVEDSLALPFFQLKSKYFEEDGYKLEVVVNSPPNFGNITQRNEFKDMVHDFENNYYTKDSESTEFWLKAYEDYMTELGFGLPTNEKVFLHHLRPFLLMNERYAYDLVFSTKNGSNDSIIVAGDPSFGEIDEDDTRLVAFRFALALTHVSSNDAKIQVANEMRNISNNYPEYNVSVYSAQLWPLADQFMVIWPQTLQNIGIALVAMLFISLVLIPHPLCSIVVAASIISIDVGLFGYMTWWHVNLDCISMITIVMSVGFSVDFAAHITYGYTACESFGCTNPELPSARLASSLGTLAWPMTQGALSTILGVLVLSTVESYMVQTFFKTVFLVVTIGLLHSLLFLPVILAISHSGFMKIRNKYNQRNNNRSTNIVIPVSKTIDKKF